MTPEIRDVLERWLDTTYEGWDDATLESLATDTRRLLDADRVAEAEAEAEAMLRAMYPLCEDKDKLQADAHILAKMLAARDAKREGAK